MKKKYIFKSLLAVIITVFFMGCDNKNLNGMKGAKGDQGDSGTPGVPGTSTTDSLVQASLNIYDDLPGVVLSITGVSGGSGSDGSFKAGDTVAATFTVKKNDKTDFPLSNLTSAGIYISGPTYNYQRVIESQSDLIKESKKNADGSYTYTFSKAIPTNYLSPLNDSASFDEANSGELQGKALDAGTYTIGLQAFKAYTIKGTVYRDVGNATYDFALGEGTKVESREVVKTDNCNRCHIKLAAHGGTRKDTKLCVLCHTSGSEDKNDPSAEGGTPGVTIDFRVMIHKIHNGEHLPSVNGVTTNDDGTRKYNAVAQAYKIIGYKNSVHDFSEVGFPEWPNMSIPLPRRAEYAALEKNKAVDDKLRKGVTACEKCHGDPDGSGELTAPAQGSLAYTQPTRKACGSCHDDVDWNKPYTADGRTMEKQPDDSSCALSSCHTETGATPSATGISLSVRDAHLHPLLNPKVNPGINIEILELKEAGAANNNGNIDPGEKVQVTFTIKNDSGADIASSAAITLNAVIAGPNYNRNFILNSSISVDKVQAADNKYTLIIPAGQIILEILGTAADDNQTENFTTSYSGHVNGLTTVYVRDTAKNGDAAALSKDAVVGQYYVYVDDLKTFAANDILVIDDGQANQEYHQISSVDKTNKLINFKENSYGFFNAGLHNTHAKGAAIMKVTLDSKKEGIDYNLDKLTGKIDEIAIGSFKAGNPIIITYTPEFIFPDKYPQPLNASPDIDETRGKWAGKKIVDGTYNLGIWAYQTITNIYKEMNYRSTSKTVTKDFLVGSASTIEPYSIISSGENCEACHTEIRFHGGSRRGFENCILCHGTAGAEDNPWSITPIPPSMPEKETLGVTISFRNMLHKIHMGKELVNADKYFISGRGATSLYSFEDIEFPAMPGKVKSCNKCHGITSVAWKEPKNRSHPTEQGKPARVWREVCGSCHDAKSVEAHIDIMTSSSGDESCEVCHGPKAEFDVELVHKNP